MSAVYTISPDQSFADALVKGMFARSKGDDFALADMTLLLPNRRAVRTVRDSFLKLSGGRPLLLPTLSAIGDVDEEAIEFLGAGFQHDSHSLNPAISQKQRQSLLMVQVTRWMNKTHAPTIAPAQSWRLAGDLMRLQDQVETEGLTFDGLKKLVSEDFASHWQKTLDFLSIVSDHWPLILEELGLINPASKRDHLINNLIQTWRKRPAKGPVIIAGSTGTIPATRALMRAVLALPQGAVILPGVDRQMPDEAWESLPAHPSHSQHIMQKTLADLHHSRADLRAWCDPENSATADSLTLGIKSRIKLMRDALLPSDAMGLWKYMDYVCDANLAKTATKGLSVLTLPSRREEALSIALIMRATLEQPSKTAALVTPDRLLASHVKAALKRWDIHVDDSAGDPASVTQTGTFLQLLADVYAQNFAPLTLVALLNHPFTALGMSREKCRRFTRQLDKYLLRGPRPAPGRDGLLRFARQKMKSQRKGSRGFSEDNFTTLTAFLDLFAPLSTVFDQGLPFKDCLTRFIQVAEECASTEEPATGAIQSGADMLWRGDAGEALARALSDLITDCDSLPAVSADDFAPLLKEMIKRETIRPKYGRHPRLMIWGTMEARLQRADVMILGGLNEGTWPADPAPDPWMSREMRLRFGLPAFERKIGQSCHDFMQAIAADTVYITRAEKVDGSPTVPSRWLLRLEALLGHLPDAPLPFGDWALQLDQARDYAPVSAPTPTPPLEARPRSLSVTQIETWMRDPYSLYARKILHLEKLDPLDARPSAAAKGTIIHRILELFLKDKDAPMSGEKGLERLIDIGRKEFEDLLVMPAVHAFWWPRFEQIAGWFIVWQESRRDSHHVALIEEKGEMHLPDLNFSLKAFVDRLDLRTDGGGYEIIDYKTGSPPSEKRVVAGYAPQLPLEALILNAGGFKGLKPGAIAAMTYIHLKGGLEVATVKNPVKDIEGTIQQAEEGLRHLIETFNDSDTPYLASPRATVTGYGEFDQLARVKEWQTSAQTGSNTGPNTGNNKGGNDG